jgi:transcriptional regulatory protein RtcR
VRSDFLLVAGTNRDLRARVRAGRFREDLLARIDLWTFRLPRLRDRPEDLEPNLDYELERAADRVGHRAAFNREARGRFLDFARAAPWPGNFREFGAAVLRMTTLARGGRIDAGLVDEECARLNAGWSEPTLDSPHGDTDPVVAALGPEQAAALDRFDRVQLADVLAVCRASPSLSAAGRTLFAASRARKAAPNDADRLRKYLARFGLRWDDVSATRDTLP